MRYGGRDGLWAAVPDPAQGAVPADTGDPGTTLTNIPVTMVVHGGYFRTVDFFRRVEVDVPRAVLVQTVNIAELDIYLGPNGRAPV